MDIGKYEFPHDQGKNLASLSQRLAGGNVYEKERLAGVRERLIRSLSNNAISPVPSNTNSIGSGIDDAPRILTITGGSSIAAMIFKAPPQFGQCSMSMSKTRLSSRSPAHAWCLSLVRR